MVRSTGQIWMLCCTTFISQRTAAWINIASHRARLRKIRIFVHLLRVVVTPVGSVCAISEVHFVNRVYIDSLPQSRCKTSVALLAISIAVHHYAGDDLPHFSTGRRCGRVSFLIGNMSWIVTCAFQQLKLRTLSALSQFRFRFPAF